MSGSLPYTVATSFAPESSKKIQASRKTYTQLVTDLEEQVGQAADSDHGRAAEEAWLRRGSTWRVKRVNEHRHSNGGGHTHDNAVKPANEEAEEAGEGTALLTGQEREEQRDRIAQVALYGEIPFLAPARQEIVL